MDLAMLISLLALIGLVAGVLWLALADDWRSIPRGLPLWVRLGRLRHGYVGQATVSLAGVVSTCLLWWGMTELINPLDRSLMALPMLAFALLAAAATSSLGRTQPTAHRAQLAFASVAVGSVLGQRTCFEASLEAVAWIASLTMPVSWICLYRCEQRRLL
jgi:hypothetical protein